MRVDGIKIDGIANIESVSLKLGEQNALIVPNGCGKSNVLRAIEFGISNAVSRIGCFVIWKAFVNF